MTEVYRALTVCLLVFPARPDLFRYENLLLRDSESRLNHAFRMADERLGIARLLDAEGEFGYCTGLGGWGVGVEGPEGGGEEEERCLHVADERC